ncbi:hypothetical protein B0A48_09612 [Cryoendolithus antarcticus]|uniref:Ubiquitin interaction domain-containing protein n=1 Tax=Cryoendolithus antarcticus TaxID=1507870 RepID=A0A1V8T049_9PEZI|nr:hypothetical protein B0A48_09612 [Cryoendolithus antarcticus]
MAPETSTPTSPKRRRATNLVTYGNKGGNQARARASRLNVSRSIMFCPNIDQIDFNAEPSQSPTKKPRTQREAMAMAATVPETAIDEVMMITMAPRDTAIRYLKVRNNDPSRAINSIMDGEDISKEEQSAMWDESAFSKDRDGMAGENRNLRPLGNSAAPTRGPSPAGSFRQPASKQEEDDDMAKALAMSQQDLGSMSGQETGVVGADGMSKAANVAFGPANRASYDTAQWAMVPIQHQYDEIVPDLEASERQNKGEEPRFLKQLPAGDYLPNFLTICHSIPLAREALLLRDHVQGYYGSDSDWWRGSVIKLPSVVHVESGLPADSAHDEADALIADTQRLMAFLDSGDRSYASSHSVAVSKVLERSPTQPLVKSFLESYVDAAQIAAGLRSEMMQLFATNVGNTSDGGIAEPFRYLVDLTSSIAPDASCNLTELIDDMLWSNGRDPFSTNDNFISQAADVLVMRVRNTYPNADKLRVEVPPELWLDKYLEDNVDVSKAVRMHAVDQRQKVAKIDGIVRKLSTWQHPTKSTQIEAKQLMQHTLTRMKQKAAEEKNLTPDGDAPIVNGVGEDHVPHYTNIANELEKLTISIDEKIARLNEHKAALLKDISALTNSTPQQLVEQGLTEQYTLMGVATKPNVTYVLRPAEDDDDDDRIYEAMTQDTTTGSTPEGMQWWRIEYTTSGSSPSISKAKWSDYEVLRAAELEHNSALLVYASDQAADIRHFNPVLPEALQRFIDEDNEHFKQELRNASSHPPPPSYDFGMDGVGGIPRQSIERGERRDSMDSTVAQQDGIDFIEADANYMDDDAHLARHGSYGLPPASKDPEAVDIVLTPPGLEDDEDERGVEMVENKGSKPIFPHSDAVMEDVDAEKMESSDVDGMSFVEHGKGEGA